MKDKKLKEIISMKQWSGANGNDNAKKKKEMIEKKNGNSQAKA